MNDHLLTQLTQELLHYEPVIRPHGDKIRVSEIGHCIKRIYLEMNNTPVDEDRIQNLQRAKFTMGLGEVWETYIIKLLDQLNIKWTKETVYNNDLNIVGHTDPIINYHNKIIILEAKGVHQRQFDTLYDLAKKNIQPESYYDQLQCYLHLYSKADTGAFIIGNRNANPQDKNPPFYLLESPRNEEWRHQTLDEPDGRMPRLNLALSTNEMPKCEFEEQSWQRRFCPYKSRCFKE